MSIVRVRSGQSSNRHYARFKRTLKSCRWCGEKGLVWFRSPAGWRLSHPYEGTFDPNPKHVHRCPAARRV